MSHSVNCPGPAFNVAGTSGFYAQMTGLLAGFAFAAIVILLTPSQNVGRQAVEGAPNQASDDNDADATKTEMRANDNGLMLALLAALFALLIATLTYSVLAGETLPQARGRAATEELVDGLPFGLAVMMLFHGITLLMDNGNISGTAVWLSRVVAMGVAPVLTLYYITNGASDTESARAAEHALKSICSGAAPLPTLGVVLTACLIVILAIALTIGRRIDKVQAATRKVQSIPPIVIVAISVNAAVLAGFVSTRTDGFLMSPLALNLYLIGASTVLALVGTILSIGSGRDQLDNVI